MKIAFKHLANCIEDVVSIEDISKKLFQLGHEHKIDNEIFDIEITPNRGDCLSLRGILRELRSFYKLNLDKEIYLKKIPNLDFDFKNLIPNACPNISFLRINIDTNVSNYKEYLDDYFERMDANRINFFTDISNYISYETGQPTHCYDFSKIKNNLRLEEHDDNDKFETLYGQTIKLKEKNIVFKSNNEIVNLAGIMGGISTACQNKTCDVLVECAYFNPEYIIGKSIKYDINSDAAYKFERGTDPLSHDYVLRRFIQIVQDHVSINSLEILNIDSKYKKQKLSFKPSKLSEIIGENIYEKNYEKYLTNLGFKVSEDVYVPSYRHDIQTENDLAEELCRVIGYDNISDKEISFPKNNFKKTNLKEDKLKKFLVDNGFYEVINNPFVQENNQESIIVDNALDSNKSYLRTDLKQSLLKNLLFNERRQKDTISLFEISDCYKKNQTIEKEKKVGIIASGRLGNNYRDFSKQYDIKYIKKMLISLDDSLDCNVEIISREDLQTRRKNKIIYVEFPLEHLSDEILKYSTLSNPPKEYAQYAAISKQPYSLRDLSFSVNKYDDYNELQDLILNYSNKILKEKFIFDFYKNEKNNEVKIGFRFIFQDEYETITDEQVDSVINDIISKTLSIESVKIPGISS